MVINISEGRITPVFPTIITSHHTLRRVFCPAVNNLLLTVHVRVHSQWDFRFGTKLQCRLSPEYFIRPSVSLSFLACQTVMYYRRCVNLGIENFLQ